MTLHHTPRRLRQQFGFSLIEFMVAMAISLAVVGGAAAVYLHSTQTQQVLTNRQNMFEGARLAMDVIGRDLENAGYYPSSFSPQLQGPDVPVVAYQNPCENPQDATARFCGFTNPPAFNNAVFGCSGQQLIRSGSGDSVSYACDALPTGVTATNVDSLVINYFTTDAGGLSVGQRGDCEGQDVAKDAINTRNGTASLTKPNRLTYATALPSPILSTQAPVLPLFVSNRYSVRPLTESIEGKDFSTLSLACDGNGNDNDANSAQASLAQPMVSGLVQLKFRYLVRDPATGNARYQASGGVTDWANVQAVRVCILAHAYRSASLPSYSLTDCNDSTQTYTDGVQRRVFTQVFALKNRLL